MVWSLDRSAGGSRTAPSLKPCPVPKPWWGDPGDETLGRRRCATEADKKISNAAKRLRSDSWDGMYYMQQNQSQG